MEARSIVANTPGAMPTMLFCEPFWLRAEATCDDANFDMEEDVMGGIPVLLVLAVCLSPGPPVFDGLDDLWLLDW